MMATMLPAAIAFSFYPHHVEHAASSPSHRAHPSVIGFSLAAGGIFPSRQRRPAVPPLSAGPPQQQTLYLDPTLSDERIKSLFAWLSRAFAGDSRYDNLMYAIAAVFGNLPKDNVLHDMVNEAKRLLPKNEEELTGAPIPMFEREQASLGAMGAAQWTGRFRTRPHALLRVTNFTDIADWEKGLPRGVRRTLKKAMAGNFTVTAKPIKGGSPAPHSSLSHFKCVVEHEVRLLNEGYPEDFLDALGEAVGRYQGTTRMAGEIREYRSLDRKVIAFAHEVRKGRVIRGQWFYATDEAAKSYVWFHSVRNLVERAIEADGVDVVDLGPSGSDAFSALKERYGFASVVDWPAVADYTGPFYHEGIESSAQNERDDLLSLMLKALDAQRDKEA